MDSTLTAQIISISGAFFLGSYNTTFSQNVIPHLYNLPSSISTPLFDKIFHKGGATIMPIATVAIAANCYLAYNSDGTTRKLYGSAAILVLASLPLTKFVMMPGIQRLVDIGRSAALQSKGVVDTEVTTLLKTWVKQNYFRGSLHLTAGLLGLFAALS
ncbi:hypothetical protein M436DRAFT_82386 [Aureobasidium namibiae CBS 147.97]|uniref:DUF1772-domain-containing protein n=1 Tax=Aureobasidium namibiae CBS 147.97 TaxID=1043004 RepID=A0A074WJ47_9PEZI